MMKNLRKLSAFAVILILIFSFSGCGSIDDSKVSSNSATDASSKTYGNFANGIFSTDKYSIELGSGWVQDDSTSDLEVAVFTRDSSSNSYSSINIREEHRDENAEQIDVDEYMETAIAQYNSMQDYEVKNSKNVKIDGRDAFELYINLKTSSQTMKMIQCYIVNGTDIYTYTFLTSSDEYKEEKSNAEKIIKTFKFKQ